MIKKYFLIIFNIFSTSVLATVRDVPSTYATISAAINASVSDDTILVGPGTYFENISINDSITGLKLIGLSGPTFTIIDGGGLGTVIEIDGRDSMDTQMLIEGFTIQNGKSTQGGGCLISNTKVMFKNVAIKNNIIENLNSTCYGAGLLINRSSVTLSNCSVKGNIIKKSNASRGGGIKCGNSTLNLDHCNLESNESHGNIWNFGAGMFIEKSFLNMNACKIQNNSLFQYSLLSGPGYCYGAGIFLSDANADIVNSLITDNNNDTTVYLYYGGGIYISTSHIVTTQKVNIRHCTIANNFSGNTYGNSIYNNIPANAPADALTLTNCILWSECISEILSANIFVPQVLNCDIKDTLYSGQNSIHLDPLFVSQNNYHIRPNSPCTNKALQIVNSDLDNNLRPMPFGQLPDIGCYEIDETINEIESVPGSTPIVFISENADKLVVKDAQGTYSIFNLSGQKIQSGLLKNGIENLIDVSQLSSNLYLISILQNTTTNFSGTFLITR